MARGGYVLQRGALPHLRDVSRASADPVDPIALGGLGGDRRGVSEGGTRALNPDVSLLGRLGSGWSPGTRYRNTARENAVAGRQSKIDGPPALTRGDRKGRSCRRSAPPIEPQA